MFNASGYDFGYSWFVGYGAAVPLAIALAVMAAATLRKWPRWVVACAGIAAAWALAALVLVNGIWGLNRPMPIPDGFLRSGSGRVLDVGAGSGRASAGVLLTRPQARITGVDIYTGYFGIDDNTPDRFMRNMRIAGAADRADAQVGDMRALPFPEQTFDAVVSSYAIDHVYGDGRTKALGEVARVLRPRGEFLLMIVNVDWWTWFVSPPMAAHTRVNVPRWRHDLEGAGFAIDQEGTWPVTRYWLARKHP